MFTTGTRITVGLRFSPLKIRMRSAMRTLQQIQHEQGPRTKVRFGGLMTIEEAIKKTREAGRREGIKLKGRMKRKKK